MNNGNLNQTLIDAQTEIRSLKNKLDSFNQINSSQNTQEMQTIYNRLNYTIQKFENTINNNMDKVIGTLMNQKPDQPAHNQKQIVYSSNDYVNKKRLPELQKNNEEQFLFQNKFLQKTQVKSRAARQQFSFDNSMRINRSDSSRMDRSFETNSYEGVPYPLYASNILKEICGQQQGTLEGNKRCPEQIGLPNIKNIVKKKLKFGRITQQPQILTQEQRNNPFIQPVSIKESQINQGIYTLINKGIIPKDADVLPAFERGAPPLLNKPANLYNFHQKLIKQEISPAFELKQEFINLKLDFTTPVKKLPDYQKHLKSHSKSVHKSGSKTKNIKNISMQTTIEKDLKKFGKTNDFSVHEFNDGINPKSYPEILDAYSQHHFLVRKAKALEDTPEFLSFKRSYNIIWGDIFLLIKEIEKIAEKYNIQCFYVDGKKLAKLTEKMKKPQVKELVYCIVNEDVVKQILGQAGTKYEGNQGKDLAAVKIQSTYRKFKKIQEYKHIQMTIKKLRKIQIKFKNYLFKRSMQQKIKEKNEQLLVSFNEVTLRFKEEWSLLKGQQHYEIHLNSFSYSELQRLTMDKQLQKQNIQITRIFGIKNPLVSIIYVCPFNITEDIINYYFKILELGEISNYKDRIIFIRPDPNNQFPSRFSLTKKLLYSPKSIQRIKKIIKGKQAYIVPGYPSSEDIKLAAELQVPLLNGNPQQCFSHSSKSQAKRFFNQINLSIPPGAFEIYDIEEFYNTLTILIISNPDVRIWIFKIDDEFSGRGIASINISNIPSLLEIILKAPAMNELLVNKISQILKQQLPFKVVTAMPSLYKDFSEYIQAFCRSGGIIEASPPNVLNNQIFSPQISLFINPAGEVDVIATFDKVSSQPFVNFGCQFPQQSLPNSEETVSIGKNVGEALFKKGISGYISIDLLVFKVQQKNQQEEYNYWGIGLDCYLNNNSASFIYFNYLMNGQYHKDLGLYKVQLIDSTTQPKNIDNFQLKKEVVETRSYFYCPFIYHEGLEKVLIKNFFQMCRLEAISFDLEKKFGSTFTLIDILQVGIIGILTIGYDGNQALKLMSLALTFLMKQAGTVNKSYSEPAGESRSDCMNIIDIISKIKIMNKRVEKEEMNHKSQIQQKKN